VIASSRRRPTKRYRATLCSCRSHAATRTSCVESNSAMNSLKVGRSTAKSSSRNSAFTATISMDATSRRSGNACAEPGPLSIRSWPVAPGASIRRLNSSCRKRASRRSNRERPIALGPDYVISYTAGRAQLETLLGEYRARAGGGASLRDFHDRLLCYGSTPFSVVGPELLADLPKPLAEVRADASY
jgi:hypothetical protein